MVESTLNLKNFKIATFKQCKVLHPFRKGDVGQFLVETLSFENLQSIPTQVYSMGKTLQLVVFGLNRCPIADTSNVKKNDQAWSYLQRIQANGGPWLWYCIHSQLYFYPFEVQHSNNP